MQIYNLVYVHLEVGEQVLHALPVLLTRRQNLIRRDNEATLPRRRRAQLESPRDLSIGNIVDVVHAATRGLVDGLAGRAVNEVESVDALDGLGDTGGKFHLVVEVIDDGAAAVAVGQEDELAVRVPVDVELDTDVVGDAEGVVGEDGHLWGVTRSLATVGLGARVGG